MILVKEKNENFIMMIDFSKKNKIFFYQIFSQFF